jgi:hypothetical protein
MSEIGTLNRKILRRSTDGRLFARIAPPAGFLSQAILDRAARRSAPEAIGAYASGAQKGVVRMPAGYRTTVIV